MRLETLAIRPLEHRQWRRRAVGRALHVIGLVAALSAPGSAMAGDPVTAASKQAQQLFFEGLALVGNEKWAEAEAKFEGAFALNPGVSTAVNLGQVQARLKKYRAAAEHLEFAVRYWPSNSQEDKRQRAEQRLAEVKREVATLTVRASVPGALLFVNGAPVGAAPIDHEIYVEPGTVEIKAEHDGYETATTSLTVAKDKSYEVPISLKVASKTDPAKASAPRSLGNADLADLHFQNGADAYKKGDYKLALEHFLESNRLVPNRNVIFNIARTYEQLRRWADAHRYYVESLRGETQPQTVADITSAIKRISPNVAVVEVETTPPGATIYLDRKDLGARGETPVPFALPEGKYRVIVELPGYEPAIVDAVEAKLGGSTRVAVALKRIVGRVLVGVEGAPGADVRADDEYGPRACEAPCSLDLPPGPHMLYFSRPGFEALPRQVIVVANEEARTTVTMTPLTGSLFVSTDEREAVIEVDGTALGFTPSVVQNVAAGRRRVKIRLRGYAPVEEEVDILPNRQSQLADVRLTPLREVAAVSRVTERIDDAPSSVSIIDGQELRAFGYPTIAEALRGTRGFALNNDHVYVSASVRGLGEPNDYGNRLLVLSEGAVLNDDVVGESFIGSDGRVDLGDVERIEVVRGPGSVLYGTGAMSGVVNLVLRGKDEPNGVSVRAGTYEDSILHAAGRVHFAQGDKMGLWATVGAARSDGRTIVAEPRDPAYGTSVSIDAADRFQSGGTSGRFWYKEWTGQWFFQSRNQRIPVGIFGTRVNDVRNFYQDDRFMAEVRYEPKISDRLQLLSRVYANHYHFRGGYVYEPPPSPRYDENYYGTWLGFETRVALTPFPALRISVGTQTEMHPDVRMIGYDGASPTPYLDAKQPFGLFAPYGALDWQIASRIRVSGGVRTDVYFSRKLPVPVVGRGAIIVRPWTDAVLKLMGGNAFRAPSIYESYYWDGGVAQIPAVAGGRSLSPENIYTGEVELSQRFFSDFVATLSGHASKVDDIITTVEVDQQGRLSPGSGIVQYRNSVTPQLAVGGDIELRREWRQGLMASVYYGYQHVQYVDVKPGDPLSRNPRVTNAPEHFGSVRGVVPVVPELLSVGARLSVEAPRRFDPTSDAVTPTAVVADVTLSGSARRYGIAYSAGVYNLADQRYTLPVTESYFVRQSPQSGRTFMLNLTYTYP